MTHIQHKKAKNKTNRCYCHDLLIDSLSTVISQFLPMKGKLFLLKNVNNNQSIDKLSVFSKFTFFYHGRQIRYFTLESTSMPSPISIHEVNQAELSNLKLRSYFIAFLKAYVLELQCIQCPHYNI